MSTTTKRSVSQLATTITIILLCAGAVSGCDRTQTVAPGPLGSSADIPHAAGIPGPPGPQSVRERPVSILPGPVTTTVVRVVDGDTVVVEPVAGVLSANGRGPGEHVVRLLGIDTPEMSLHKATGPECGAKAATDHLGGILPRGLPVVVEYDPKSARVDRYGRSLAYLATPSLTDAGRQQVADGYAMPWYPIGEPEPDRLPEYRAVADAAVRQHAGAHSQCRTLGRG